MDRVITYIDGLNLYYGIRKAGWFRLLWFDPWSLSDSMLDAGQELAGVRYFAARFQEDPGGSTKRIDQGAHFDAMALDSRIDQYFGYFLPKHVWCGCCNEERVTFEEKMTDVNIASQILCDFEDDKLDTAVVVSGDSDLVTPIQIALERNPTKRVVVAFPPRRVSKHLQQVASHWFKMSESALSDSQFPDTLLVAGGYELRRPEAWR